MTGTAQLLGSRDCGEVALGIVAGLLEAQTGQALGANRVWRVSGALSGVLRRNGLRSIDELADLLSRPGREEIGQQVVEALLNNETSFFRDRSLFDHLSSAVLPDLANARSRARRLSIWSAGCSSGQETYSLAMLFAARPELWRGWRIDILGTDVAPGMIETAWRGEYSQFQIQRGLGIGQTIDFFEELSGGWRANPALRGMVRFQQHNLLDDPPEPARFDLILCRNVLLYFDGANRRLAFDRLAQAIAPHGWLMLGLGETTTGFTDCFRSLRNGWGFHLAEPTLDLAEGK